MPNLDVKVEYSWNTLSADSKDHIPFIGPSKKDPRRIYLIGVGGNGLVHSMAGASIIADYIDGIKNPYAGVVKAKRK
jgi:glycine/D-amino acid oxidase-like deaminating enzyme